MILKTLCLSHLFRVINQSKKFERFTEAIVSDRFWGDTIDSMSKSLVLCYKPI